MILISEQQLPSIIKRLSHQILETHPGLDNTLIIGLQPRGVFLSDRIVAALHQELPADQVVYGKLDITFYRDDFRRRDRAIIPNVTNIDFIIENKRVILIDDVLFTGRTIRSGIDALFAFGRPASVELLALVDRRFKRQLPIQADYIGKTVDTLSSERVNVEWKEMEGEDKIVLYSQEK